MLQSRGLRTQVVGDITEAQADPPHLVVAAQRRRATPCVVTRQRRSAVHERRIEPCGEAPEASGSEPQGGGIAIHPIHSGRSVEPSGTVRAVT